MAERLTDTIRSYVVDHYVVPARRAGQRKLTVRVRDIKEELGTRQLMRGKSAVICQALQGQKWLNEIGLTVESIDGPPSKKSPTVVMHYKLDRDDKQDVSGRPDAMKEESAEIWADEIVSKLKGLLKEELAAYGGAEAFMRWVRSEEKKAS
jgi:hypothetical protein